MGKVHRLFVYDIIINIRTNINANKKNADIVFVPKGNYKEAKKYKDKEKYDFDLVSVSTFDEAVDYLRK